MSHSTVASCLALYQTLWTLKPSRMHSHDTP
jgi:hypothetical protein